MKRKILVILLCAVMALSVLVGCNGGSDNNGGTPASGDTIKLVLWGAADDREMLSEMVDAFKAEHRDKNYSIEIRVTGEDVARDEALKDIEAAADVFAITNDQLGALVNANAVYENTVYADEIRQTRTEGSVTAATIDGKLYGFPSSSESYFLFYDKSKLTEDDVKSLESILAKPQPSGVIKFGFDFSDAYFSSAFFMTAGCEIYGSDGQDPSTVTFNSDEGLEASRYIAKLKGMGAADLEGDVAGAQFKAGKLAAYVSGSWKTEAYTDALGDDLGFAKLPTIKIAGEDRDMVSFSGGKMYVVKSTTEYPLEAMALANWLTNEENQIKRFKDRNMLPNYKSLAAEDDILSNPAAAAETAQFAHSVPTPSITQISRYWDPVAAYTKDLFDGKIKDDQIRSKLDTLVSDITA
ncbi:MAG: extracellular solute-binding protein [Clostridia bacterium]|nr:extracellular solute-binding protein [Clostridia bacterium]